MRTKLLSIIFFLPAVFTARQASAQCMVIASATQVSCYGYCDGSAVATGNGAAPFTYSWAPGGQTTQTISNQCAGTYTVTQTDNNGCIATATVNITQPAPVVITTSQTNPSCNNTCDGTATVNVSGGTPPYTYSWNTTPQQTTATATGLCGGVVINTFTDNHGCTQLTTFNIVQPQQLGLTTTGSASICPGNCAQIAGSATGGTSPYTYTWTPAAGLICSTCAVTTVCPGSTTSYTLQVTDTNGCSYTGAPITITVNPCTGIEEAAAAEVLITSDPFTRSIDITSQSNMEKVMIYDINGKLVWEKENAGTNIGIDTGTMKPGIYFVQVYDGSAWIRKKLVRQ